MFSGSGGGTPGGPQRAARHRRRVIALVAAFAATTATCVGLTWAPTAKASAAALSDGWATVAGKGSGKCVDARAAAGANGTAVQQYATTTP